MDEYLEGIMNRPQKATMHLRYTEEQKAVREDLIRLIEAEKRAYYERIEPYLKKLEAIEATAMPTIVIQTALR